MTMFQFLPWLLGGAAIGGILHRNDPLKGALIGASLGAAGSAIPGLLAAGPAATTAAAAPGSQAAMLASQEAGLSGADLLGWGGAQTGAQGWLNRTIGPETGAQVGGLLGTANTMAKPVGTAVAAAEAMRPPEKQLPPPPSLIAPTASPVFAQLNSAYQQLLQDQYAADMQRRTQRLANIKRIGA